ncbi:MAG: hypothetical protein M1836_002669 [Candelina mexicana]|nr:MAG: hypothetical protein M1836_002669 [Candelina mexicana]
MLYSLLGISIYHLLIVLLSSHTILASTDDDTLVEAIKSGRAPRCSPEYGHPILSECSDALDDFIGIIQRRGFELDQIIEFLGWGINPLHADKFPRQGISATSYSFKSISAGGDTTCMVRFGMEEPTILPTNPNDPLLAYPSSLATHNDFVASTRLLISLCVERLNLGGHMKIRGVTGRDILVVVSNVRLESFAINILDSILYDPPPQNKQLFTGNVRAQGGSWPWFGDPGQGSSTGAGEGRDGEWWVRYCNIGLSFAAGQCAINQVCEPVELKKEEVMWGVAVEIMLRFAGRCLDAGQAKASSASFWTQRRRI